MLVDCTKLIQVVSDFLTLLESIYVFMSASKAHVIFVEKQKQLRPGKQTIELKRLIETQWACRHLVIEAVRKTFGAIPSTLQAMTLTRV